MFVGMKRILLHSVLALVSVISIAFLILPTHLKLYYVLDRAHQAKVKPKGTWLNMTCPQCGRQLEQIVINPDNPLTADEAWRYAYYCRQEGIFWVADCPGWYFAGWYGPFNSYWKLANTVAIIIVILSGAAFVLSVIRDKC